MINEIVQSMLKILCSGASTVIVRVPSSLGQPGSTGPAIMTMGSCVGGQPGAPATARTARVRPVGARESYGLIPAGSLVGRDDTRRVPRRPQVIGDDTTVLSVVDRVVDRAVTCLSARSWIGRRTGGGRGVQAGTVDGAGLDRLAGSGAVARGHRRGGMRAWCGRGGPGLPARWPHAGAVRRVRPPSSPR